MGDMADMMREEAEIDLIITYGVAQEMTDKEIVNVITEVTSNKKNEDGFYIHGFYEPNDFTPMIKDIADYYKKNDFMSKKQREVLNKHYGVHGNTPERFN